MTPLVPLLLACAGSTPVAPAPAPEAPPVASAAPAASFYALQARFVDQRGVAVGFDVGRGHPTLVSMFYASCTTACPMLLAKLQSVEAALPPAARAELRVVLVSFDDTRDTPEALAKLAADHGLDGRWSLLHADAGTVREVAALLGFRYQRQPTGEYDHSTGITLLDAEGVVLRQVDGLGAPVDDLVADIVRVARGAEGPPG